MRFQLLFLLLFVSHFSFSQSEVFLFKDTSGALTEKTIVKKEFKIVEKQVLEFYSDDVFWFKIPAHHTEAEYIFSITYERIRNAEVYQNSKKIEKLKHQRFLSYKFSRESDVYVKINPKLHSYIPFKLDVAEIAITKNNNQLLINGFYYGFAFLIIILNFCYYFFFEDAAFLYYAFFLAAMTFGVFTMDGMLNYFEITGNLNDLIMVLNYIFLVFFSLKFVNKYLFFDTYYPRLRRVTYAVGVVIILIGVLFLVFKNFYFLFALGVLVFSTLLVYWIYSIYLFKKNLYTKILVFAYVIILFSGIDYYIFNFLGFSLLNTNAITIKIGAFSEMIILSIAVLFRMKSLKDENEHMRSEIIEYSKKMNVLAENKQESKANKLNYLSLREEEIFELILEGKSNKQLANELNVSINTIKFHIKNIYEKLQVKNRKEVMNLKKIYK